MSLGGWALTGWALAVACLGWALAGRRQLAVRMEALRRACHELRGPLTAVGLGLELEACRRPGGPSRMRPIELELGRAALALEDLGRIGCSRRAGRTASRPAAEAVDVAELVGDSVAAARAAAERAGVELAASWSGPNAIVAGQRVRLAQALGNLIANAIEHGGGRVLVQGRADRGAVRVEVLDDGPGLSAPLAELIRRRRRDRPDRGRGLQIAGAVAAAHGGRLAAAPSHGGARLVLELPAAGSQTIAI